MFGRRLNVILLIVTVAVNGVLVWQHDDVTAGPAASPSLRAVASTYPEHVLVPNKLTVFLNIKVEVPLSEQVDRLLASHDPEKALTAYHLLSNCDQFNRLHDRLTFDLAELKNWHRDSLPGYRGMTDSEKQHDKVLCGSMTERMRQSRIDYLAIAAMAGVSGAAVSFAQEGPFGDRTAIISRPNDPLVLEWKERARAQLTRDAEAADLLALNDLWLRNMTGDELYEKNPELAFRYGVAMGKIYEEINAPNDVLSSLYSEKGQLMQSVSKDMSPEQRATAVAEAQRIAEIASQRRKRSKAILETSRLAPGVER